LEVLDDGRCERVVDRGPPGHQIVDDCRGQGEPADQRAGARGRPSRRALPSPAAPAVGCPALELGPRAH